jgi:predicted transglutaminase-like cysteine proteinase
LSTFPLFNGRVEKGIGVTGSRGVFGAFKAYFDRNRLGELLVRQKALTPTQLHEALHLQKREKITLGELLVRDGYASRWQVQRALATQTALRSVAAAFAVMVSTSTVSLKPAWAGAVKDVPSKLVLVAASVDGIGSYPELFGSGEKRSSDLSAFTKWSAVFSRFDRELSTSAGDKIAEVWKRDLAHLKGQSLETMADGVNDLVNRVKYIGDNRNWGKSDYWETPVEFFARGGDCEDFAITKYTFLRALGVPENRLRIAIVKDMEKGIPHAILIVYTDSGAKVLDNQIKSMKSASQIKHYKPIFSINRTAWWLHTPRGPRPTLIASAAQ